MESGDWPDVFLETPAGSSLLCKQRGPLHHDGVKYLFGPLESLTFPHDRILTHTISAKIRHQQRCVAFVELEFRQDFLLFWPEWLTRLRGYSQRLSDRVSDCSVHSLLDDFVRVPCYSHHPATSI